MEEVKLTSEMRKRLGEYMPIDVDAEYKYVPVMFRDLPKEQQPVFTLKRLDGFTIARLQDKLYTKVVSMGDTKAKAETTVNRGAFVEEACRLGVVRYDNYFGKKWEKTGLGIIPEQLLKHLANQITAGAHLSEDEERGLE